MKDKLVKALFNIRVSNLTSAEDILNKTFSFKDAFEKCKDFGGEEISPQSDWSKMKRTNYANAIFITESDFKLKIPIRFFIPNFEDWEIMEFLSILDYEKPIIDFEFFKMGELYNPPFKSSTVKYENKIVKSICLINNKFKIPLDEFVKKKRRVISNNEFKNLLEDYIFEYGYDEFINNDAEQEENECYSVKDKSYYDNDFYNDSLDLDQQDPEFWDSL